MKKENKLILDACCGNRMMWFDKHNPNCLYIDNRRTAKGFIRSRNNFEIDPDVVMDFRALALESNSFKLIVWDPPHLKSLCETSIYAKKFGCLNAETWQYDLKKGFQELWRVLDNFGILIFKWSSYEIPLKKVLGLFPIDTLFGHTVKSKVGTHWLCFMKIPKEKTS